ncbi:TPA: fimbrial protein [Enterobacter asburiae]|uniref:fimbrial protein n=1 Tax=Enterobacter cloacae complex TaxID=354276 RepID=UPI000940E09D|nr:MULTISPECIES: fimbrial protein [Enterobacter cloacae complex]MBJ3795000.1 fimbrial protein [Enterobacter asburiae]HBM7602496.1 fimbrial protein [Enterobacter asburiae]HBM7609026.1 fimbrial protein [Enterobacter asburiae]HBM7635128.1 fimbrial protein [Enterobacter asburiae]HBM7663347.1 fimbrial protein [Enterobacter asburiae]
MTNYHTYQQGRCSVSLQGTYYVPVSGYYTVGVRGVTSDGKTLVGYASQARYIDASKPLNNQDVNPGTSGSWQSEGTTSFDACDTLKGPDGQIYFLNTYGKCTGQKLPPTPVVNTSCTINSGNALSVSLGSLDRSTLPTIPSSSTAKHINIPVSCTGGDVTVSMNITYTAITIGSTQAVKTSANGVGTAIIYNNAAVSPTSKATINLKSGSNTVDLGFQAIRDSAVAVKDIPTGAFTASAVMVMTQQ